MRKFMNSAQPRQRSRILFLCWIAATLLVAILLIREIRGGHGLKKNEAGTAKPAADVPVKTTLVRRETSETILKRSEP